MVSFLGPTPVPCRKPDKCGTVCLSCVYPSGLQVLCSLGLRSMVRIRVGFIVYLILYLNSNPNPSANSNLFWPTGTPLLERNGEISASLTFRN
jgi:hypothetical protein